MKPAVFLDRDGTIIELVHYPRDPADVKVLPGAAAALRRLRDAGYACVVVTNQAGIGRGLLTHADYERVQREVMRQLEAEGARLDATYYCPIRGRGDDRTTVEHPDRKPGPGMLITAARELGLDLGRSWMVGDMISDVLAGRNAGCRGSVLLQPGSVDAAADPGASLHDVAADLAAAVRLILERDGVRTSEVMNPMEES